MISTTNTTHQRHTKSMFSHHYGSSTQAPQSSPCFRKCEQKSVWGPLSATSAFPRQQGHSNSPSVAIVFFRFSLPCNKCGHCFFFNSLSSVTSVARIVFFFNSPSHVTSVAIFYSQTIQQAQEHRKCFPCGQIFEAREESPEKIHCT